jgi:hypothetical protein
MVDFLTVKNQNNPLSMFSPHPCPSPRRRGEKEPPSSFIRQYCRVNFAMTTRLQEEGRIFVLLFQRRLICELGSLAE